MARQAISINAVFVGLCALIPIPFLDDLLRKLMMRGAYQAIAEQQRVELTDDALEELSRGPKLRVLGCLFGLVWYGFKKISKKILYFLAIKDALDWAAEAAIRGELVRIALSRGLRSADAERIRSLMDAAWKEHGGSPVTRSLLGYDHPKLDWELREGTAVPAVRALARRSAGARVVAAFVAALDGGAAAVNEGEPVSEKTPPEAGSSSGAARGPAENRS